MVLRIEKKNLFCMLYHFFSGTLLQPRMFIANLLHYNVTYRYEDINDHCSYIYHLQLQQL